MATATDTPTIRARIREALNDEANPRAVAAALVESLPDEELRPALAMALPYLVADEVRKVRHDAIGRPHPHETTGHDGENRVAHMDDTGPPPADPARSAALRTAGRKGFEGAQARRERDSALLRTPVALGKNEWKALGDLTSGDLRKMARFQRQRAAENEQRADAWDKLADALDKAGADTVRQLDEGAVRAAVGRG